MKEKYFVDALDFLGFRVYTLSMSKDIGFGDPDTWRTSRAHLTGQRLFFLVRSTTPFMAGRAGHPQGCAGPRSGSPTRTRLPPPSFGDEEAGLETYLESFMADISTGASALLASDLQIDITPRAYTQYQGTAAQLIAEGLIPDGFKWPSGSNRVTIEVGKFSLWIGRKRPEGHKGPMSSWTSGDCWFVRRELSSQTRDGFRAADIYAKTKELADIIYRGTNEYARIANASWNARCDDKYQAFRSLVVPAQKQRGRPAKTTTTQTQGVSA